MENLTFKFVTDDEELAGALSVRRQVFVREQGVAEELEYDGLDEEAQHMVVKDGTSIIGIARVRFLAGNRAKIERMAILKLYHRQGIGSAMISFLQRELKGRGVEQLILHAQCVAAEFYKSQGFTATGKTFLEADIEHIKMRLRL